MTIKLHTDVLVKNENTGRIILTTPRRMAALNFVAIDEIQILDEGFSGHDQFAQFGELRSGLAFVSGLVDDYGNAYISTWYLEVQYTRFKWPSEAIDDLLAAMPANAAPAELSIALAWLYVVAARLRNMSLQNQQQRETFISCAKESINLLGSPFIDGKVRLVTHKNRIRDIELYTKKGDTEAYHRLQEFYRNFQDSLVTNPLIAASTIVHNKLLSSPSQSDVDWPQEFRLTVFLLLALAFNAWSMDNSAHTSCHPFYVAATTDWAVMRFVAGSDLQTETYQNVVMGAVLLETQKVSRDEFILIHGGCVRFFYHDCDAEIILHGWKQSIALNARGLAEPLNQTEWNWLLGQDVHITKTVKQINPSASFLDEHTVEWGNACTSAASTLCEDAKQGTPPEDGLWEVLLPAKIRGGVLSRIGVSSLRVATKKTGLWVRPILTDGSFMGTVWWTPEQSEKLLHTLVLWGNIFSNVVTVELWLWCAALWRDFCREGATVFCNPYTSAAMKPVQSPQPSHKCGRSVVELPRRHIESLIPKQPKIVAWGDEQEQEDIEKVKTTPGRHFVRQYVRRLQPGQSPSKAKQTQFASLPIVTRYFLAGSAALPDDMTYVPSYQRGAKKLQEGPEGLLIKRVRAQGLLAVAMLMNDPEEEG